VVKPKSELVLYQTEDGRTRVEVRLENETVWLSLNQMADLFQRDKKVFCHGAKQDSLGGTWPYGGGNHFAAGGRNEDQKQARPADRQT